MRARPFLPLLLGALLLTTSPTYAQSANRPLTPEEMPALPTPLDAAGFDARTKGRTITYHSGGAPYGVEQYLDGRRVRWVFTEGLCKYGTWHQSGRQICFAYGDQSEEQCWIFSDQPEGLMAWFGGNLLDTPLVATQESTTPLSCAGPEVGA